MMFKLFIDLSHNVTPKLKKNKEVKFKYMFIFIILLGNISWFIKNFGNLFKYNS